MSTTQDLQQWRVDEPYLNIHCLLGEGPYYETATNSLRFVDIKGKRVHAVNLNDGPESLTTLQLDAPVSVTADIEGVDPQEKILIGIKYGVAILDRRTGTYKYLTRFEAERHSDGMRSNDGAVDPHGRFWLGSMTDFGFGEPKAEGVVYIFNGDVPARAMWGPVTIPNSVCWSPDRSTMYFTHSSERTISAHKYELDGTGVSNEHVFYKHEGLGEPDGARVDVDGNLWQAVYGEGRVLKITPTGELVGEVLLPTKNITCVQFVGTELYITTAAMEKGEGTPEQVELSGALFRVDVGVRGLPPFEFKRDEWTPPE